MLDKKIAEYPMGLGRNQEENINILRGEKK